MLLAFNRWRRDPFPWDQYPPARIKKAEPKPRFSGIRMVRAGSVGRLRLVLLFLELLGEVLVVLGDEVLQLLLAVLDVGLLQRGTVIGAGEAVERDLHRVRLVLEVDRGQRDDVA